MHRSLGVLCSLFAIPIWAQSTSTGTVSGQVTDQQNAAVPEAVVELIDIATSTARSTATNEAGRYSLINVPPAVYSVTVTKPGFQSARVMGQKVTVGLVLTLDVTLLVGAVATAVEVTAAAGAELQTTSATVGKTITGDSLAIVTNLGRDANGLIVLQPAVAPNGEVAGAVRDQNSYQLDGGNNTSDMDGTQATYTPSSGTIGTAATGGTPSGVMPTPVESIEEFKVATNNQTADFNSSAGGQVQMVTKRGTNEFHGSVYEHYLGSNFGANTWKNNHTPLPSANLPYTPLPSSHQSRFGASLGGPLTPEFLGGKTYFFFNYEGRRFPQTTTIEKLVPTPMLRQGIVQLPDSSNKYVPYNLNPSR